MFSKASPKLKVAHDIRLVVALQLGEVPLHWVMSMLRIQTSAHVKWSISSAMMERIGRVALSQDDIGLE